jgi:hypothetical protein
MREMLTELLTNPYASCASRNKARAFDVFPQLSWTVGVDMLTSEECRKQAEECVSLADRDPHNKDRWLDMTKAWLRLAIEADQLKEFVNRSNDFKQDNFSN